MTSIHADFAVIQNLRALGHGGFHSDFKEKPGSQAMCGSVGTTSGILSDGDA
jgi:hypothetical protein